jgi:hypothetical protein
MESPSPCDIREFETCRLPSFRRGLILREHGYPQPARRARVWVNYARLDCF